MRPPGRGASSRQSSPGSSSLAMQRAISAWTGSVSWNSSTSRTGKRRRKYARASGLSASRSRAHSSRSSKSATPSALRAASYRATKSSASGRQRDDRLGAERLLRSVDRVAHVLAERLRLGAARRGRPSRPCLPLFRCSPRRAVEDLAVELDRVGARRPSSARAKSTIASHVARRRPRPVPT